ncbi:MAG: patatin-like phospholipase family protein [Devosia sp.]
MANLLSKLRLAFAFVLLAFVAGCATFGAEMRNPVPAQDANTATIPNATPIRFWGDETRQNVSLKLQVHSTGAILSLSGGGANGAYGAGYLLGWTARGDRPKFDIVTGISVGALIAPMAFLGPRYDSRLQSVFVNLASQKSDGANVLGALFGAPSVLDNTSIKNAIAALVDQQALDEIASESRTGRKLVIGTTNLDAQRPVVWDIGAIANSDIPGKLALVRQIMLASAAVPGIYAPVLIHVDADGRIYDEMHVDGGVTQQVVLLPRGVSFHGKGTLYVIYNNTIAPTRDPVTTVSGFSVLSHAVPTMLKYGGRNDLVVLEAAAKKVGLGYHVTAIPPTFPPSPSYLGDPEWLSKLFAFGYKRGQDGDWETDREAFASR